MNSVGARVWQWAYLRASLPGMLTGSMQFHVDKGRSCLGDNQVVIVHLGGWIHEIPPGINPPPHTLLRMAGSRVCKLHQGDFQAKRAWVGGFLPRAGTDRQLRITGALLRHSGKLWK
jgi:hypothetical protein